MKNRDILLDVIGDVNKKFVPELTAKKKRNSILKWTALGSACAAAIISCAVFLPKNSNDGTIPTTPQTGSSKNETLPETPEISSNNVMLLAAPVYPEIPMYPDETDENAYIAWENARFALRDQPKDYKNGFDSFFSVSTRTFLTGTGNENRVYSPLSLYMALGMSAEITDGSTRQQILDVLAQEDIDTLRSHSKSIWQANYMDDGMAKCVLAASLWTNDNFICNQNTVSFVADNYYSSVFSGDPVNEEYNRLMQDWLNEQTDGLLTDYVSDIGMDPEMVLTLVSTVNYSGKWNYKFSKELTKPRTFHSAAGDVQCDFMNSERDTTYFWGEKYSSVIMPLENNGHMRLILPDEGISPEELINDDGVIDYLMNMPDYSSGKYVTVNLSVPKFDISSNIDLIEGLNKLGIADIFDSERADFTPLSENSEGIALSKAEQDSRVLIDEEGCKAASLTVMLYDGAAMPEDDHVDFVLDRPFIFEIMSETGLPLFVGIVNNPVQ